MKTAIAFVVATIAANAIGLTLIYNAAQNADFGTAQPITEQTQG